MRLFHQPPAQNLAEWLDLATRDLVPSAQARIRTEIEAHYAEAVQTQLAKGSTEAGAQAAAVADLGDAKAAARRFRRQCLTTKHAQAVAGYVKSAQAYMAIFLISTFQSYDVHLDYYTNSRTGICLAINYLLLIVVAANAAAIFILGRRPKTPEIRRKIIGVLSLQLLTLAPLWLLYDFEGFIEPWRDVPADYAGTVLMPFVTTFMLSFGFCGSLYFYRLRKKLLTVSESDIPAADTRPTGPSIR